MRLWAAELETTHPPLVIGVAGNSMLLVFLSYQGIASAMPKITSSDDPLGAAVAFARTFAFAMKTTA